MVNLNWINLLVLLLIVLSPLALIFLLLALIKKQRKYILHAITISIVIFVPIVIFYAPVPIILQDPNELTVTINMGGDNFSLRTPEQINEIKELVEGQKFIRSVSKTLTGVQHYPSYQGINIRFEGRNFSYLMFIRKDVGKSSYLLKYGQYYSINDTDFVKKLVNFTSRVAVGKSQ